MSKTNKILIIILAILLIITIVFCLKFLNKEEDNTQIGDGEYEMATTTLKERQKWSDFLSKNPYISELMITEGYRADYTDLIKLAISSEEIETERIVTEEIKKNPMLSTGDGYKKSREKIDEYVGKIIKDAKISYNFVETYVENQEYLIIDSEYVYFTKIELPEREYILMDFKQDNNNFEARIYEYEINEDNKAEIRTMLESGSINPNIEKNKTYTITGIMNNGDICISTKK